MKETHKMLRAKEHREVDYWGFEERTGIKQEKKKGHVPDPPPKKKQGTVHVQTFRKQAVQGGRGKKRNSRGRV